MSRNGFCWLSATRCRHNLSLLRQRKRVFAGGGGNRKAIIRLDERGPGIFRQIVALCCAPEELADILSRSVTQPVQRSHRVAENSYQTMTTEDNWRRTDPFAANGFEGGPVENSAVSRKVADPFDKVLGLLDLEILNAIQFSNFRSLGGYVGKRAPWGQSLLLGHGVSFIVRRVPYNPYEHSVAVWDDPREPRDSKFVVFKQPLLSKINSEKEGDANRLQAVLTEMKILYHQPIRRHPNIVKLLQLRWDTQDGPNLIAPSLVLEHADLGSLSAFQNPGRVVLHSRAKTQICLDIAEGLYFLHRCAIVHGDVKSE